MAFPDSKVNSREAIAILHGTNLYLGPVKRSILFLIVLLLTACDAYGPKPTPAQSPTPKPTVAPQATIGPLSQVTVAKLGLTMLTPSSWKPPVDLADNSVVLSPDGSNNT